VSDLDEICVAIWAKREPPMSLAIAAACSRPFTSKLPDASRASFDRLARALDRWWLERDRKLADVHALEFAECLALYGAREGKNDRAVESAMRGAHIQFRALLPFGTAPQEGFNTLRVGDFQEFVRSSGKAERAPAAQLLPRLERAWSLRERPWVEIVAAIDRMGWGRVAPGWSELSPRLKEIAAFADLGAESSWTIAGPRSTLRLTLDRAGRTAALDEAERASLVRVIPWLAES
jgi:hypothetical protein